VSGRAAPNRHPGLKRAAEFRESRVRPRPRRRQGREGPNASERALTYKTYLLTGLRKSELATLTVGQLDLDGPMPCAVLDAADASAG